MGNKTSIPKVNFEDMQNILERNIHNNTSIIINTLENTCDAQRCLLPGTLFYGDEEKVINNYCRENKNVQIIIYGKNANDISIYEKYTQLLELGFVNKFSGNFFLTFCVTNALLTDGTKPFAFSLFVVDE